MLELPRYKTDETCREKFLLAITSCGDIDTDYGHVPDEDDDDDDY